MSHDACYNPLVSKHLSGLTCKEDIKVTLFDLSVLIFFLLITVKAVHDTMMFWKEADEAVAVRRQVVVTPRHRPAPMRPSPAALRPAASARAAVVRLRPAPARTKKSTAA